MEELYGNKIMIMDNEILYGLSNLFAVIWFWSMIIAVASFIISNILFLFFKLLKNRKRFLDICALVFIHISRVLAYISLAAAILMIIPTFLECCNK